MSPQFHSALSIYKSPQEILKIINFGRLMLVGQHPMESLCSVRPSVRPSLSFLKIGSLFFFLILFMMIADHDI